MSGNNTAGVKQAETKEHRHQWEYLPGGAMPRRRCEEGCGAYERLHGDFHFHRHDDELKAAEVLAFALGWKPKDATT